jgi:flagellar protein FlaG
MINDVVNTGFQPRAASLEAPVTAVTQLSSRVPAESPSATAEATATQPVSTDSNQLQKAVSKLNDYVQNLQHNLSFSVSDETGRTVIKVYDAETDELIRQIPSEETIKLAASIDASSASLFVKERA